MPQGCRCPGAGADTDPFPQLTAGQRENMGLETQASQTLVSKSLLEVGVGLVLRQRRRGLSGVSQSSMGYQQNATYLDS